MLELKSVTKIYRTKGSETRALDGVSLTFEKTGLVFLLGKSGSGKSTLLNLAGGLDSPTQGEIVVMGKSFRDFSGSDLDAYRNTFVGFVFQEYNVLGEFNVEDNISLALELQGKKGEGRTREILEEVGISALAKRRPDTLSGGQKQRVAIARALVKDPRIIMADEPTGALDSKTGEQVFETLKKLSEKRLILVVSHDREFAERYADRIIELADGRVVSDVSKTHETPKPLSASLTAHGNETLTFRHGCPADGETLQTIKEFLETSEEDVLLVRGREDGDKVRRALKLEEGGARERFAPSPASAPYTGEPAALIRSRLPAAKAFRIGVSGLRLKPVRLAFTMLLSVVAFVLFGLFSTMMLYDGDRTLTSSMLQSDYAFFTAEKSYTTRVTSLTDPSLHYETQTQAILTPAEVSALGGKDAFGAYSVSLPAPSNYAVDARYDSYYRPLLSRVAALPLSHPLVSDMVGSYPVSPDQIAVSEYFVECLQNGTFTRLNEKGERGDTLEISSAEDLLGERVAFGDLLFTISGVFRRSNIGEKYAVLKEDDSNWILRVMFEMTLSEGLPTLALVSEDFFDAFKDLFGYGDNLPAVEYFDAARESFLLYYGRSGYNYTYENDVQILKADCPFPVVLFGEQTGLPENGFVVPYYILEQYYDLNHGTAEAELLDYARFTAGYEAWALGRVTETEEGGFSKTREATAEEREAGLAAVQEYVAKYPPQLELQVGEGPREAAVFSGVYLPAPGYIWGGALCSESFYTRVGGHKERVRETKYVPEEDACYSCAFLPFEKTEASLRALMQKFVYDETTDVSYDLVNILYENVGLVNTIVGTLEQVFLWAGVAFAVFASLLLFNFISASIAGKNREIGILRAVGARGSDVFRIFFAESGVIVSVCTLLSIAGSALLVNVLNTVLRATAGLDVTLFVFGPLSALIMIAAAAVVALLSTFLPVYLAAHKKPVDCIRTL